MSSSVSRATWSLPRKSSRSAIQYPPNTLPANVRTTAMTIEFPNASQTPCASQTLSQLSKVKPFQMMLVRFESLNENAIVYTIGTMR